MSIATSTGTSTEATTPLTLNAIDIIAINDKKIRPWQFCCYWSKMTLYVT
jgi:hypothetical protein